VVAKENNALVITFRSTTRRRAMASRSGLPLANARRHLFRICRSTIADNRWQTRKKRSDGQIADWLRPLPRRLVALDAPHGLFLDITGCAHLFRRRGS